MAEQREYQVPIIFDVTAPDVETASACIVDVLSAHQLPRTTSAAEVKHGAMVESWWTLEKVAKQYDGNDNEHGVIIFEGDIDYLFLLLMEHGEGPQSARLMHYFNPGGARCGASYYDGDTDA